MAKENQQIQDIRAQVNHLHAEMVTTVATKAEVRGSETSVRGLETSINDLKTDLRQLVNSQSGNRAGTSRGQQEHGGNSLLGEDSRSKMNLPPLMASSLRRCDWNFHDSTVRTRRRGAAGQNSFLTITALLTRNACSFPRSIWRVELWYGSKS